MQEKATAIETALLFFELEWAALDDARAEELLAADGLDFARHHLRSARRYRPHLLSEPEERIFTERALTGRTAWTRLFEEQASAITVELPGRDRAGVARGRALAPVRTRPRAAPRHRRAGHEGARPGPAHARVRVQHAAGGQDGRGPAAPLPELARQPQPRQRGVRRVRAGAGRGGPRPLRGPAPLVPAEGAAARGRQARRLRPPGAGLRRRRARRLERRARPRARLLRLVLGRARRPREALLRRALDRRAGAPEQARRRVLRLHGALRAPVRAAQLHLQAPRRDDARARARARRARGARRPPGRLPHEHAADARGDRERVRRADRLRAAARARRDAGVAARRC